jgi:hypothetical protein
VSLEPRHASLYDAFFTSVADATDMPLADVHDALAHRFQPGDAFWAAWDNAVREAHELYATVREWPVCDECGEAIPPVEGGGLANRHHDESCSLYDAEGR